MAVYWLMPGYLSAIFSFAGFAPALASIINVDAIPETHDPVMLTSWIKVAVTCWTYNLNTLHGSELILAARLDAL